MCIDDQISCTCHMLKRTGNEENHVSANTKSQWGWDYNYIWNVNDKFKNDVYKVYGWVIFLSNKTNISRESLRGVLRVQLIYVLKIEKKMGNNGEKLYSRSSTSTKREWMEDRMSKSGYRVQHLSLIHIWRCRRRG